MPLINSEPFEVIQGPFTAYYALVGTAKPTLDVNPDTVDWIKIGASGALNQSRSQGVVVTHRQSINPFRGAGDPGVYKNFRTEEDLLVEFSLADMTLEAYRIALNQNTITETSPASPVPGYKTIGLSRGNNIRTIALLLKSDESPYQATGKRQYHIPRCQETGSPAVAGGQAGTPAMLALQFSALVDPDASTEEERFGTLDVEDSTAVTAT